MYKKSAFDLTGRRALVTGGSRGLGQGIAVALATAGAEVCVTARARSSLDATLSQVPWSSAEHRIHAAAADATTAEQLGIEQGTACLVIERRTWSAGAAVTQVRLTYPGDRHALVATFTPSS